MANTFDIGIRELSRTFNLRLKVNDTYIDVDIRSMRIVKGLMSDDLSFGTMFIPSLELELLESESNLLGKKIFVELGLEVDKSYENISMGAFYVTEESSSQGLTKIVAVGALGYKFDGLYVSELEYPTTFGEMATEIATKCGVEILFEDEEMETRLYDQIPEGLECREVLCEIASMCNANVSEDSFGKVVIRSLCSGKTYEYDGDYCIASPTFNETYSLTKGDDEVCFNPAEISFALGDPRIEPWDIILFRASDDKEYVVPAINIVHTFDGGLSTAISAPGGERIAKEQIKTGPITEKMERAYVKMQAVEKQLVDKANINELEVVDAKVEELRGVSASLEKLKVEVSEMEKSYVDSLGAVNAEVEKLQVEKLSADTAEIEQAWVEKLLVQGGIISPNVNGVNGAFSHDLTGVNIIGDNITAGTISAKRLVIANEDGEEGLLFALNEYTNSLKEIPLDKEEIERLTLDGKIITADSINADKINVTDLFAQDITSTGSFNLGGNKALFYDSKSGNLSIEAQEITLRGKSVLTDENLKEYRTLVQQTKEQIALEAEKNAENAESMKKLRARVGVMAEGIDFAVKTAEDVNTTFTFTEKGFEIGKSDSAIKSVQDNESYKFKDNSDTVLLNIDTSGVDASSINVEKQVSYYGQWATRKGLAVEGVGYNLNDVWIGGLL